MNEAQGKEKKKQGRPRMYTEELADKICALIGGTSMSLKTICDEDGMPSVATIFNWLSDERYTKFLEKYTRAREQKAEFMAEEILEIADDGSNDFMTITKGDQEYTVENKEWTSRSKLRVEARKWLMSKMMPKKYGDKIQTEHTGEINVTQITGMEIK